MNKWVNKRDAIDMEDRPKGKFGGPDMISIKKRKRIFYEGIDSIGRFPDGRIKLDLHFRSQDGDQFVWTPPWRAVIDLTAAAKYIEETNKPRSEWNTELEESYKKLQETSEFSNKIFKIAGQIAAMLHPIYGSSAIKKLFPLQIPSDLKNKSEQIIFILSNAKNLDDFIVNLQSIINAHKDYFIENKQSKHNLHRILQKVGLSLDDRLNIVKNLS
jgi:hypothetical protein